MQIQPGNIATVAGNGSGGYAGDNGQATSAELEIPEGVAVDSAENIYISDTFDQRIRKVNTAGVISTTGGDGFYGFNGDQIPATSAWLGDPVGIAVDSSANIYFADLANNRIRRIDSSVAPTATQLIVSAPAQVGDGIPFNFTVTAEDAEHQPGDHLLRHRAVQQQRLFGSSTHASHADQRNWLIPGHAQQRRQPANLGHRPGECMDHRIVREYRCHSRSTFDHLAIHASPGRLRL